MLTPGTRLGRFAVVDLVGSGGMGEVYRARDESLERFVALKTIRSEVTGDTNRVHRFIQEARAASALNHPHIVHIYEIGEAAGLHYIAMELIDGVTLRQKLIARPAMADTVRWLGQVGEALAKAHAAGIIHRDLKPENIMISSDGYAKVLDFGLAKLIEPAWQVDETTKTRPMLSASGILLGTPAYMSPEQIDHRPLEPRSDVFSLGCVLFEALTGQHPFPGRSALEMMQLVVRGRPASPPRFIPEALATLIERCLAKEPADRPYASEVASALRRGVASKEVRSRRQIASVATLLALIVLVTSVALLRNRRHSPAVAARASQPAPPISIEPVFTGMGVQSAVISRDGRYVAYVARSAPERTLRLRDLHTDGDTQITSTAGRPQYLIAFAPGASHLHLLSAARSNEFDLIRIPLLGGAATVLQRNVTHAKFSPDFTRYAFSRTEGDHETIHLVEAASGAERKLCSLTAGQTLNGLAWTRDRSALVLAIRDFRFRSHIDVVQLSTARRTTLLEWDGVVEDIASLPGSDGVVMAASRRGTSNGHLYLVAAGVATQLTTAADSTMMQLSLSDRGVASSIRVRHASTIWKVPVDRPARRIEMIAEPSGQPGLSGIAETPDGRIAYGVYTESGRGIRIAGADGHNPNPLTEGEADSYPAISPDGRFAAYQRFSAGMRRIWIRDIATGRERMLTTTGYESAPEFSPDGQWVYFLDWKSFSIGRVPSAGGVSTLLTKDVPCSMPDASPDGQHVAAWCLDRAEQKSKLMVFPSAGGKPTHRIDPGTSHLYSWVRWSADSRELYFNREILGVANIWKVALTDPRPKQVTTFDSGTIFHHEITRDGRKLLLARGSEDWQLTLIKGLPVK